MSRANELEFRRVELREVERFEPLFSRAFQKPQLGYFRWKYVDNPAGPAVAYEARDGATIAGFYGAMPEVWTVRGTSVTLFQSMDTMTDPNYRGRGLFVDLAKLTMKAIDEEYSGWMIGFPGHTSIGGFVNKLGWKNIAHVRIRFSLRQVLSLSSSLGKRARFELERVELVGPEFDKYWSERETRPLEIQKRYSTNFLNWRVFDRPANPCQVHYVHADSRIIGVIVHRSELTSLHLQLCDFLSEDLYAAYMVPAITALARATDKSWIEMYEPNLPWARRALSLAGAIVNPFGRGRFSHHRPFIVWAGKHSKMASDVYDYSQYDMHSLALDY